MKTRWTLLAVGLLALAAQAQPTAFQEDVIPQARTLTFAQLDRAEAMARYGHPNEMWRYRALRALKLEQGTRALDYFRFAAKYGDKFSQHALSLMYWHGVGAAADRAQAYAWSDLAAERGYRDLLLVREKMWMEMNAADRARALLLGEGVYAEYGDAVAKPRQAWAMRRALANATGSRVGASTDRIQFLGGDYSARDFYAEERWEQDTYWREQDRQWKAKVIVLPLEQLPERSPTPTEETTP
jgi:uncharacterized protein